MREFIIDRPQVILICGKANDTLFVQMNFHRAHRCYQHINTHIPLVTTDEQRVVDVPLYDALLVVVELGNVV